MVNASVLLAMRSSASAFGAAIASLALASMCFCPLSKASCKISMRLISAGWREGLDAAGGDHLVVGVDHGDVEVSADPHGIGVDQDVDRKGAAMAAPHSIEW